MEVLERDDIRERYTGQSKQCPDAHIIPSTDRDSEPTDRPELLQGTEFTPVCSLSIRNYKSMTNAVNVWKLSNMILNSPKTSKSPKRNDKIS